MLLQRIEANLDAASADVRDMQRSLTMIALKLGVTDARMASLEDRLERIEARIVTRYAAP
jgi:hypothetical protein